MLGELAEGGGRHRLVSLASNWVNFFRSGGGGWRRGRGGGPGRSGGDRCRDWRGAAAIDDADEAAATLPFPHLQWLVGRDEVRSTADGEHGERGGGGKSWGGHDCCWDGVRYGCLRSMDDEGERRLRL